MPRVVLAGDANSSLRTSNYGRPRRLANSVAVISCLTVWANAARQSGRTERVNKLYLLIWEAYGNKLISAMDGSSVLT